MSRIKTSLAAADREQFPVILALVAGSIPVISACGARNRELRALLRRAGMSPRHQHNTVIELKGSLLAC